MHEELLGNGEEREPTSHPHIFRVRTNHISDRTALQRQIDEVIALAEAQRNGELVRRLWETVENTDDADMPALSLVTSTWRH